MNRNIIVLTLLIILAAAARFIPHGYHFTPIGAMALLGGAYFNKKYLSIIVPILALFITDVILNNVLFRSFFPDQEGLVLFADFMIYTYLGTLGTVLIGMFLLKKITALRLIGGALFSSLLFFLITNFGTWASGFMYPMTGGGLLAAYVAGLPFLSGHLVGNLVFSFILFGAYEVIMNREITALAKMHL